ncbi:UNVERIFIED_CONTAM: hypothetical protein Sangu_1447300 [Sesamum angustifolium]|uniref:RNase H type-1 domain-containing protein n=1 Tax=Sesamum angustifolium TaxID=2727405 RepID=A0AAW2N8M9_9LAMI
MKWNPQNPGLYKVNFDEALFPHSGDAELGVIIRDEKCECRAWRSIRIPHVRNAELAEALAAGEHWKHA